MVYLNPPYYYIDGVSILPDHADKRQWYFLPVYPRFSTNPATGDLQLSFLKYRGQAGDGGFLNFDVNIGLDQPALDAIAAKLKDAAGLDGDPILSPVPLIDGMVRLIIFDQQTPVPPPPGTTGTGPGTPGTTTTTGLRLVEHILQAVKPSLYGDNQAIFSSQLTQYGVTVLDQALRGTMTPIGIIYDLDYVALRPAFQVKLSVDWDRVSHYVDQMQGVDGMFVSVQIDKAISDLKDSRAIVMEADLFVPEGEDASTVVSDFARAEAEVREMFTDAFFKPSLEPDKQAKDGWDRAADFGNQLSRNAVTGGMSSLFTYSKKEIDLTRIDHKSINANLQERTAVRRSIHPQGHLGGIASILAGDPSKYIMAVDLDSPYFERRKVTALSRASFPDDQLDSIHVEALYGNTPHDVVLDPTNPSRDMEWLSIVTDKKFQWPVSYHYQITFHNVDTSQRPMQLSTRGLPDWPRTTVDSTVEVVPRVDLYTIVDVPIYAVAFPFDHWPHVEVETLYIDEPNGLKQQGHFVLDANWEKAKDLLHWKVLVLDRTKTAFQYRISYFGADNQVVTMPLVATDDEQIRVFDPYPVKRTLSLVPDFDWSKVDRAFADVTYTDPRNNVSQSQSYEFNSSKKDTQTFSVDLRDPNLRQVQYELTVIFRDGHDVVVPRSYTLLPRVILRTDMKGHRVITLRSEQRPFAAVGLTRMDVDIRYTDAQAGISAEDNLTLKSPKDRGQFEFDYVDEQRSKYEYLVTYRYDNGLSRSTEWAQSDLDELILMVS